MKRLPQVAKYLAVLAACFALGLIAGNNSLAGHVDDSAYDLMLARLKTNSAWSPQSVVVAIDEAGIEKFNSIRNLRTILSYALDRIAMANPKAVAIDVTLHDEADPVEDARLEASMRATRNLILPCELAGTVWEDPAARFKSIAAAIGHVHTEKDRSDGVSRRIDLEQIASGDRRWALALEAYRIANRTEIIDSPEDVQIGDKLIPTARADSNGGGGRPMLVRFLPAGTIPSIPVTELDRKLDLLRGKTVFLGVTALSAADRVVGPYGNNMPGVEMHAQVYETLAQGEFFDPTEHIVWLGICAIFTVVIGLIFGLVPGWKADLLALIPVAIAIYLPFAMLRHNIKFPVFSPIAVATITWAGAASFQHFYVRRQLVKTESEKARYQQAMHWVAHEMRTPLTAIQGSSEIMSRYNLTDEKRQQLSEMINSESKRMAKMIQTFLDLERLGDGQIELKRDAFNICDVAASCYKRALPLAERKQIKVILDTSMDANLIGDRELMEYALYNLLTNAIKYSGSETEVNVFAQQRGNDLRLSVRDQGMGMDQDEVKKVFTKFYRTKRAETSGEVGTGIGLSIVEQIVTRHGGRMEVTSEPGKGSCFTIVLKAELSANSNAETADRRG